MILSHDGVKSAARDWSTFSNDAPFRVPIPSEEDVRSVRQLPIETDPPEHGEYRRIAEPFFNRPKDPVMAAAACDLIRKMLHEAVGQEKIEVVRDFALPLQSKALALLLNVPMEESEEWIGWGTHVFHDGPGGEAKGSALEDYIHRRLDQAAANPGGDFFSALTRAEFRGRPLTREEQAGFVNLTFAGGRDTVINTIAGIIGHFVCQPDDLTRMRKAPELLMTATEEFFRFLSPLTHIGRVCPHETQVGGMTVPPQGRISLGWASANRDTSIFKNPDAVLLDRKPNQHLAFGSGPHTCLGALHARLLVRTLLRELPAIVARIVGIEEEPQLEQQADYTRRNGYRRLVVKMEPLPPMPL
jgi:cytochrome P450